MDLARIASVICQARPDIGVTREAVFLRLLRFLNWLALGTGAVMALMYAVVCLMMLPYPQLVAKAGGDFAHVLQLTGMLTLFTATAGLATWLLQKRRAHWRLGQCLLAVMLVVLVGFVVATR